MLEFEARISADCADFANFEPRISRDFTDLPQDEREE
jgi:hypothetical protein